MKDTYTIKYRLHGQWFWRTLKDVRDDWIVYGRYEAIPQPDNTVIRIGYEPMFRAFLDEAGNLSYISLDAEVVFPNARQVVLSARLNKEAGRV